MDKQYLVAFLVVLFTVSATTLLFSYDDSLKEAGLLYKLAHYMRYIYSGLGHR